MNARLASLIAVLALVAAGCSFNRYPAKAEIDFSFEASLDTIRTLEVATGNGKIVVSCTDEATKSSVRGTKSARGVDDAEARAMTELITFTVGPGNAPDSLRIEAIFPDELRRRSPGASFEIVVPRQLSFDLQTSNGNVEIDRAHGDVVMKTSNGKIAATAVEGAVNAQTSNGKVRVNGIAGDVTIKSSNGSLTIEDIGGSLVATTSNGKITATGTRGSPRLETSNGSISLRAAQLPPNPEVYLRTSNGSIEAVLPDTVSGVLDMETSNARVHPELVGASIKVLEKGKRRYRAEIGGGGGSIRMKSSNGPVTCRLSERLTRE